MVKFSARGALVGVIFTALCLLAAFLALGIAMFFMWLAATFGIWASAGALVVIVIVGGALVGAFNG